MGIITLKKDDKDNNDNVYDILDGQQRLTTLIILTDYLCDLIRLNNRNYKDGLGINIEQLNVDIIDNVIEKNGIGKEKYIEIYNYFASLYANSGEINPEQLMLIIENRLFWLIQFAEDDKHDVFEAINATGKPLEYADLLLNYLLDIDGSHDEEKEKNLEKRWNEILARIYSGVLPEDSADIDADNHNEKTKMKKRKTKMRLSRKMFAMSLLKMIIIKN